MNREDIVKISRTIIEVIKEVSLYGLVLGRFIKILELILLAII